jgi:hypothetical protein
MNFPPFWARAASGDFWCGRWSKHSLPEAQTFAAQAVRQLADRFRHGDVPQPHPGYYPDRPFRELVLREIKNRAGDGAAVLTRKSPRARAIAKLASATRIRTFNSSWVCMRNHPGGLHSGTGLINQLVQGFRRFEGHK